MSLLQFINSAGEVLERGDVVVIAARQPNIQGHPGIPSIEVDLARRDYDSTVCGVVQDLYTEHKVESEPRADPKEKTSGRARGQASAGTAQAFTLNELATLDRTKIAPSQVGFVVAGGLCVVCKVDADIASIKAGDLLTTSATKGHAQKVVDSAKAVGSVLGKALGSLKKGKGTIPVLVSLG